MHSALIKPQWSPVTIILMVLGFMLWWPLGLAMLGYIAWGEYFGGSKEQAEAFVDGVRSKVDGYRHRSNASTHSGNRAFDEYRSAELKRLDEERRRLEQEREEFSEFMRNLRMARDREEFDRFMADRNRRHHNDPNGEHSSGDRPDYS